MEIQPFGDSAIIVTFEKVISEEVNQKVISLYEALKVQKGISYLIPAYNSLTIGYDIENWKFVTISDLVKVTINGTPKLSSTSERKVYSIPVCYEKPFDLDSLEVCEQIDLTKEELIQMHTGQVFRVYMLGFVAGFAYMGSLPEHLACKRKATPRLRVPKGSVGLAGLQTGIYPTEAPGGWQIIGQTPLNMFDPNRGQTSLLAPGDYVKFRAIGLEEFKIIQLKIETEIFEMEEAYA
ncbi:5-oxoprolinase subunit PxpB [Roseivirga sp. E12]|uniref:5-oxoprolinase subunit PxpB n=1 Tax=Roseivirga sp. E12 TaxID=2819237 RepID=UPI001ABD46C8|nr:5-oxoprolinase subunit PxpB [Roseivirga sp. E12]MBO3700569.1 5-oxoprolinase subunit PxpB [Roseivirga sp. E12]